MEGELISVDQVWFGIREPEWWPEDEEDFEERLFVPKKVTFRKELKIRRKN